MNRRDLLRLAARRKRPEPESIIELIAEAEGFEITNTGLPASSNPTTIAELVALASVPEPPKPKPKRGLLQRLVNPVPATEPTDAEPSPEEPQPRTKPCCGGVSEWCCSYPEDPAGWKRR